MVKSFSFPVSLNFTLLSEQLSLERSFNSFSNIVSIRQCLIGILKIGDTREVVHSVL